MVLEDLQATASAVGWCVELPREEQAGPGWEGVKQRFLPPFPSTPDCWQARREAL